MRLLHFFPCALACFAAACSSDSSSEGPKQPDGGQNTPDSGIPGEPGKPDAGSPAEPDSGTLPPPPDGGSDEWDTRPILARPSKDTHACKVERDRTTYTGKSWGSAGHALVATTGKSAFFARLESTGSAPFEQGPAKFLVSRLGLDGTFAGNVEPSTASSDTLAAPAMAPRADGFVAVWVEGGALRFAGFDATGAVTTPSKNLASGAVDFSSRPHLAAAKNGDFGIVYTSETASGAAPQVRFLVIDANGNSKGASQPVKQLPATVFNSATQVVADDAGYAILFHDVKGAQGQVFFTARSATGAERIAPRQVSVVNDDGISSGTGAGFERGNIALLHTTAGYLAAWTEVQSGTGMSGAAAIVRVAKMRPDGTLEHDPVAVRDAVVDVDEGEVSLSPYGDAVALLWAHGTHIYVCGGCVPDHRIDLVLIDASTLDPLSAVVSLAKRAGSGGGLVARDSAILGADLLLTFDEQFHTSAEPGSAAFSCDAR